VKRSLLIILVLLALVSTATGEIKGIMAVGTAVNSDGVGSKICPSIRTAAVVEVNGVYIITPLKMTWREGTEQYEQYAAGVHYGFPMNKYFFFTVGFNGSYWDVTDDSQVPVSYADTEATLTWFPFGMSKDMKSFGITMSLDYTYDNRIVTFASYVTTAF